MMVEKTSAASPQNFCFNTTVLKTRTACHSCSITLLIPCPSGFRPTPGSTMKDCKYYINTASLKLAVSGCSFECYKEEKMKICCPGFWGPDCMECPEQADRPCSGRGVCSDGLGGNGTCSCQVGFAGTACEDCAPGRYGPTCSSACSCVHGLCSSGLKGDGRCLCFSGYSGSNCDKELPECAALSCQQNSRCIEEALTGRLVCQCLPGYQRSGDQCLSINPCLQRVCHAQASCVHTGPNQHQCTCNEGYSGDGQICMAVDPCQTNQGGCSPESARCIYDGPGKSHCECLTDYEQLSSGACALKDVCRPNSCHKNANCTTVEPGQVECTCHHGYLGNGKICYGNIMQRLTDLNTEPGGQWTGRLTNAISLFGSLLWPLQNLGPFTLFVPINQGFRGTTVKTLKPNANYLCKMHMVAGEVPFDTLKKTNVFYTLTGRSAEVDTSEGYSQTKIRIHGSRRKGVIIQSDVVAYNGMIHIINKLMDSVPPTVKGDPEENLMKIISDHSIFDKFKSLLEKTNLVSVLDLPGPITVFAPSSEAFNGMTEGHLEYLSSAEGQNKLVEFLRNHIVPSTSLEVYNAVSSPRIVTMANQVLTINVTENGQIVVNGATVLEAAVEAKNGLLYALDGVLTPPTIEPILPHRCDITETKITMGKCVRCSLIQESPCLSGVFTGSRTFGCVYTISMGTPNIDIPLKGCAPKCNDTVTTAACCKGFYGPDCRPCPGGYQTPCSGHGQCLEGIEGNGTCICEANFRGSRCQYCSSSNKFGPNCDRTCLCIHGRCDNRPNSDGRCKLDSCTQGYTGQFCDRRTRACGVQAQFCHAHAECVFNQGTPRCVCKPGFQGDGITCVESDPCAPPLRGGCSVNAKCIKTGPGSHTCQCLNGWRDDGDECQPINNCDSPDKGGCHPSATCVYIGPGQELMALPEASDFYTWTTRSGLSESLSNENITLLVPSSAAVAKMLAEDKNFWTMKGNLPSLIRNHMITGNYPLSSLSSLSSVMSLLGTTLSVSATNEMTAIGRATISTSNVAATNGMIHIIDTVLVPDRKLSEGLLATLALRPEFSLFRSYLMDYNLTNEIEQADKFTIFAPTDSAIMEYCQKTAEPKMDINTTRYHVVPSQYLLKTELQPGGYKETLLGFSFQLGIFPRDGKLFVNDAQINSSNILSDKGVIHGLSAVLQINKNRCDRVEYKKIKGLCVDCLYHQSKVCPNDTIPDKSERASKCMFNRVLENKQLMTIGCRATCLQKNIELTCCGGFFGTHCEPCPGPRDQPCFGNGMCLDGISGSGVCQCNKGFNGTACETCQSGKYGVHCDQECECKNGRCNEGLKGDGTCECDVGWRGIHCDEKITSESDELCGGLKCHSSANCVSRLSSPSCHCAAGFKGNGTFCQAVDPCLSDNGGCSQYAVCKRTRPGHRDCVCNSGYSGDGLVCVEINPCLEGNGGCHANADCIHVGPNKTSCACTKGYSGDGQNCMMMNVCKTKNGGCNRFALCNMTGPGTRDCTCRKGFIGDGLTCKGTVSREIITRGDSRFYYLFMMMEIPLEGHGPFTVFLPGIQPSIIKSFRGMEKNKQLSNILRSHIVMCHTLLAVDLSQPRNLTSLSGLVLTTSSKQGTIFINEANVTKSDHICANGIIHDLDQMLFPLNFDKDNIVVLPDLSQQNLIDVAGRDGYKTFYKLLEDTGVMDLVSDVLYQPVTIFLPSDSIMASLPQEQKDFLFHQHNRPQLLEYLKYHVLQNQRVYAEGLLYLDSARTMQGSPLSFSCGGMDNIGEIFINDGKCRIVQRHLVFKGGIAYGIDCLLTPPSLGGRCDSQTTFDLPMNCGRCSSSATRCPAGFIRKEVQKCDLRALYFSKDSGCRPICSVNIWQSKCCRGHYGRDCLVCPGGIRSPCSNRGKCDDGHLGNGTCTCDSEFSGTACELCAPGFYGPTCKACNCTEHGSCDDGRRGTGLCFCEEGWTGEQCEIKQTVVFQCSPPCSPKAVCKENNTCVCRPFHEGDGYTCTVVDMCQIWNGGCAKGAKCTQKGGKVSCTCPKGHSGDGFTCLPIDPCASGENGGCDQHATCTMTAPGKKRCTCKAHYIGDGVTCEVKQLPISRCLQNNGQCHQDAICTDLHFEDATLGVFHYRSKSGQYKLNYTAAQQACTAAGGSLATYNQLHYAQQGGLNMCAAGWLDQVRVAYPTTYSNPNCGFGHVGIVDYGTRKNLSETWDTFCYRIKEVKCECKLGYVGDGLTCIGNLLQILKSTPSFSNFLIQILNSSLTSESGKQFLKRLGNLTVQSTLFVPDNTGLPVNQTLSLRDIEFHLSEGQALPLNQLKNGSRIRTHVGSLTVLGVTDQLNPSTLSSCYINDRFVIDSDIQAANGIIHVLQGPLKAPSPRQQMHVAHKAGMGIGVVLLVVLVAGFIFVGYHFYRRNAKPFRFHYFKEDDGEDEAPSSNNNRSICNPVYEGAAEAAASNTSAVTEDKHQVVDGGGYDLLQYS
ncbi:stabilin-2 isoform 2-T2 [Pholidichthys leucotaenia]